MEKILKCINCGCDVNSWFIIITDMFLPIFLEILIIGIIFDFILKRVEKRKWKDSKNFYLAQLIRVLDDIRLEFIPSSLRKLNTNIYKVGTTKVETLFEWAPMEGESIDEKLNSLLEIHITDNLQSISSFIEVTEKDIKEFMSVHLVRIDPSFYEKILRLQFLLKNISINIKVDKRFSEEIKKQVIELIYHIDVINNYIDDK